VLCRQYEVSLALRESFAPAPLALLSSSFRRRREAAYKLGDDEGVGVPVDCNRRRAFPVVAEESEDELGGALVAAGRPVDELLHRRLELGDPAPPAVFLRLDPLAERAGDQPAQAARTLRPSARIAGLTGTEAGGPGRPAVACRLLLPGAVREGQGDHARLFLPRHPPEQKVSFFFPFSESRAMLLFFESSTAERTSGHDHGSGSPPGAAPFNPYARALRAAADAALNPDSNSSL